MRVDPGRLWVWYRQLNLVFGHELVVFIGRWQVCHGLILKQL